MEPATYWLSLAIWVPIVAGMVVMATGGDQNARIARPLALVGAIAGFLITIPLYTRFNVATSAMQFVERSPWIERFNVYYHLGVDGISVLFILLNSFITVLVVIAGWRLTSNTRTCTVRTVVAWPSLAVKVKMNGVSVAVALLTMSWLGVHSK